MFSRIPFLVWFLVRTAHREICMRDGWDKQSGNQCFRKALIVAHTHYCWPGGSPPRWGQQSHPHSFSSLQLPQVQGQAGVKLHGHGHQLSARYHRSGVYHSERQFRVSVCPLGFQITLFYFTSSFSCSLSAYHRQSHSLPHTSLPAPSQGPWLVTFIWVPNCPFWRF